MKAYQSEMRNFTLELPTITFNKSYMIKDKAHELHVEFHGHAHTAGDVVVFCPQKRAIATGDMIHGFLPFIADGFPKSWPNTVDSVARLDFDRLCPGHGPVQRAKGRLIDLRNYIEELTEKVETGKKAGKSIADLQAGITVASLKSMQSNGYSNYVRDNQYKYFPNFGPAAPLQDGVNNNIVETWNNLEKI
jgi:glyoxylase-like metal-dependent hydrolase (beta-lactamase superfamily II)